MTYLEMLERLRSLGSSLGVRPGLEATRAALDRLGRPETRFPSLHVAGTNGKGSTAACAEAMLRAAGQRTGLYTSPHLSRFTERIRVDGEEVSRERVAGWVEKVIALGESLTFFEVATVAAFCIFAEEKVDIAVVEVGLGGRLDATNLCVSASTAITGIGLDHTEVLGYSLAAIAGEKAGIAKPGVPLVVGATEPGAEAVILEKSSAVGAPVHVWGRDFRAWLEAGALEYRGPGGDLRGAKLALAGLHQARNAGLALAATALLPAPLRPDERARRVGLADVRWPGRLEPVAPRLWLDAAHNPDGARALVSTLVEVGVRRPVLLIGVLADKDADGILEPLLPSVAQVVCCRPESPRALPPEVLAAAVRRLAPALPVEIVDSPAAALERAHTLAAASETSVVGCGSIFLVGALRRAVTGEVADPEPVSDPPAVLR